MRNFINKMAANFLLETLKRKISEYKNRSPHEDSELGHRIKVAELLVKNIESARY